jgi:pantothenate synthetase
MTALSLFLLCCFLFVKPNQVFSINKNIPIKHYFHISVRSGLAEAARNGRVTEEERATATRKTNEALNWLEANQTATAEDIIRKLEEVEAACKSVMLKAFRQSVNSNTQDVQ